MMDHRSHDQMLKLRDAIYEAHQSESRSRHSVEEQDSDAWVLKEQRVVRNTANRWAHKHGLRPVTLDDVQHLEVPALGHIDYMSKFALYVAEYVYGVRERYS